MTVKTFTKLIGATAAAIICLAGTAQAQAQTWNIGTTGDSSNVTATLSEDGTLTVSGEGAMRDFGQSGAARSPWIVAGVQNEINIVIIEDGVTSVGAWAFRDNTGITEVIIGDDVTSIGWGAFDRCTALATVTVGNSVTLIGSSAFNGCANLASINIPNSVTTIENNAFRDCSKLTSVNIPNSVTTIGGFVFAGSGLTSVTIPGSVTSIGQGVFLDCADLTTVVIEEGVTSISVYMFANAGLTSVTIPNSVTIIEMGAFGGGHCALTSVTIGSGVTEIGNFVFGGCPDLTSVTVLSSVPYSIPSNVFDDLIKSTATLYVPQGSVNAYNTAEGWGEFADIEPITTTAINISSPAANAAVSAPHAILCGRTLSVASSTGTAAHIRLLDVRGRTVRSFTSTGPANFSLSAVPAGRYFVEIREGGQRFTSGIVVR